MHLQKAVTLILNTNGNNCHIIPKNCLFKSFFKSFCVILSLQVGRYLIQHSHAQLKSHETGGVGYLGGESEKIE